MADPKKKILVKVKKNPKESKVVEDPIKKNKSAIIKDLGVSNESSSNLKGKVEYVQRGVTDSKGDNGSYIYYKDPKKGGINIDTDRDFVKDDNIPSANQTQRMREYNSRKK